MCVPLHHTKSGEISVDLKKFKKQWSQQKFEHETHTVLPWHVRIVRGIWLLELQPNEFRVGLDLWAENW